MIFAGITHFSSAPPYNLVKRIEKAIVHFSHNSHHSIKKDNFSIHYSILSSEISLQSKNSMVFGKIFSQNTCIPIEREDFLKIKGNSSHIFKSFWGKYIFVQEKEDFIELCADPTGKTSVYYKQLPDGNFLFGSDINIFAYILNQDELSYNLGYLSSLVIYGESDTQDTLYKEVTKLPAGNNLILRRYSRETKLQWSLERYTHFPYDSKNEKEFISLMLKTITAWIAPYERVIVELSGGLDSSTLVYLLNQAVKKNNKKIIAVNYYTSDDKGSIEIDHAKKVTDHIGIPLYSYDLNDFYFFSPPEHIPLLNKPATILASWAYQDSICKMMDIKSTDLIITGNGGDHVFMSSPSIYTVVDSFLSTNGPRAIETLKNICSFYRSSFISTAYKNLIALCRYIINLPITNEFQDSIPEWMTNKMREIAVKPYNQSFPSQLPGKQAQLVSIYKGLEFSNLSMSPSIEILCPFLNQPILEWAASIPSYLLYGEGYDRYPVRKSISKFFDTQTVWRRDKGNTTGHFLKSIKRNREWILEVCLNGLFVRNGIVKKSPLEKHIMQLAMGEPLCIWPFMNLYCTEIFLLGWEKNGKFNNTTK